MKVEYIIHEDERGGYWAEVPAIPGCVTEGRTLEELAENVKDAAEGCLAVLFEDFAERADSVGTGNAGLSPQFGSGALSLSFRAPSFRGANRRNHSSCRMALA